MTVNEDKTRLINLLACPDCRGTLTDDARGLLCTGCGRLFSSSARVPHLMPLRDTPDPPSILTRFHYALLGSPHVYNFQQAHFGGKPVVDQLQARLADAHGVTILDIGAGTGVVAELAPADTDYLWLDNDEQKLRGLLAREPDCLAIRGDATRLPLRDNIADWTLMVEVSHHLPDAAFRFAVEEAARVTRGRFVFVDAVRGPRLRSKLMWQLDLGRNPRPEEHILRVLEAQFELGKIERFRGVNHDHVLCVCAPRIPVSTAALTDR